MPRPLTPLLCLTVTATVSAGGPVRFDRDVRPILSDRCFACHGPDAANREAGLRLDLEASAKESAVVPGDPGASELVARVFAGDEFTRMPPPDSHLSLTAAEKGVLRRWVAEGADWSAHWAFVPPRRAAVPAVRGTGDGGRGLRDANQVPSDSTLVPRPPSPRDPIDAFIDAKLADAGLTAAPPADRATLLRRATFALTGLPPTPAEVDRFLADGRPDAFARVVDRLLASPRFGERMAADWLDVARYGDSYGYQVDRDRFVWPWRDWVVRAFNRNLPFDEFLTQQLAGDLLPPAADRAATDGQVLATAFNRLHPQKVEGGSVPEEFRVEYVADRTQTVATGMLGLTLECARCHDHKYDPLAQREYYAMTAFFANVDEAGLYSYFTDAVPTPALPLVDGPTAQKLAALDREIAAAEASLAAVDEGQRRRFEAWAEEERTSGGRGRPALTPDEREGVPRAAPGSVRSHARTRMVRTAGGGPAHAGERAARGSGPTPATREVPSSPPGELLHLDFEADPAGPNNLASGVIGTAVRLTGDDAIETGSKDAPVGNFRRFDPFTVSLWMNTPDAKERAVVFHRSRAWTDAAGRGYELLLEEGRLSFALTHFWPGDAVRITTARPLPVGDWHHVAVTHDGSARAAGMAIRVDGRRAEVTVVRDGLTREITGGGGDSIAIGGRFRDRGFTGGLVDEFRVFDRELTPPEIRGLHDGGSLRRLLRTPAGELTDADRRDLLDLWRATVDPEAAARRAGLRVLRAERADLFDATPAIMVMRETPAPHDTFVLDRGAYDARGARVTADVPAALPPFPAGLPRDRLGLARWMTAPDHPLTGRVAVNHVWQLLFGTGLVRTPEDFGSQGEPPTHPDLLDTLTVDLARGGWDVKRLVRRVVLSAAWRRSSSASPGLSAADPENRLLGRFPAHRLPAEMLRDQALAAGGLLVERLGGPPVRPYEVEQAFKPTGRDRGAGLYRRSLYTYWNKTAPAPAMRALDAGTREVCRVRRERTASPSEAFVLMNGPQFVEAARGAAEGVLHEHAGDTDAALSALFRTLTARRPTGRELAVLRGLYEAQHARFAADPPRAAAYLSVGDRPPDAGFAPVRLAAVAAAANALLGYDGSVMQR